MIKIIIIETIVLIFLSIISSKLIIQHFVNKKMLIVNIIVWVITILSSILLNLDYYLYFISFFVIGIICTTIFIIKLIEISINKIIFWLLFGISTISLFGFLITKYFAYKSLSNHGEKGSKGIGGEMGYRFNKNQQYLFDIIPEKCYKKTVNEIDNFLIELCRINNRPYNEHEYILKNMFFKDLIKKKCYSTEFLDEIFKLHSQKSNLTKPCNFTNSNTPESSSKPINTDKLDKCDTKTCPVNYECSYFKDTTLRACVSSPNKKEAYDYYTKDTDIKLNTDRALKKLIIKVKVWVLEILRNSEHDNKSLLKKLGGSSNYSLGQIFGDTSSIEPGKCNDLEKDYKLDCQISKYLSDLKNHNPIETTQAANPSTLCAKNKNIFDRKPLKLGTNLQRFNNKLGWKFLEDRFLNEGYWNSIIVKNYLDKYNKQNPICYIKNHLN